MSHALTQVEVEPTALYLNLAVSMMMKWESSRPIEQLPLKSSVQGLIEQIFKELSSAYGERLVEAILGFLTFSVAGKHRNRF
jgi:hypothetical protein